MYEDLVNELRHYFEDVPLVLQAADAIEELQKRVPKAPHGLLIDADALATVTEMVNGEWKTYIEVFEVADDPTIIEAEEGE